MTNKTKLIKKPYVDCYAKGVKTTKVNDVNEITHHLYDSVKYKPNDNLYFISIKCVDDTFNKIFDASCEFDAMDIFLKTMPKMIYEKSKNGKYHNRCVSFIKDKQTGDMHIYALVNMKNTSLLKIYKLFNKFNEKYFRNTDFGFFGWASISERSVVNLIHPALYNSANFVQIQDWAHLTEQVEYLADNYGYISWIREFDINTPTDEYEIDLYCPNISDYPDIA